MKYWTYIHTCPNGKKYVGVTTQKKPERRWRGGLGYKTQLFGKAVIKYGWDNILHEVFEMETKEEMYYLEKYLIAYYNSNNPDKGYNLSEGGEQASMGVQRSEEYRRKQSLARKGKKRDKDFCQRVSEGLQDKLKDPEFHKKLSEGHRRTWQDPSFRERMSQIHKNIPHPRIKYLHPDGTILEITIQTASRNYFKKGINLIRIEERTP